MSCPAPTAPSCDTCLKSPSTKGCEAIRCQAPAVTCDDCAKDATLPACALMLCLPQPTCDSCAKDPTILGCNSIKCPGTWMPTCAACAKVPSTPGCDRMRCATPPKPPPCICTKEYAPVCGINAFGVASTYANKCLAKCAKAVCSIPGRCNNPQPKPPIVGRMCIEIYQPVCGVPVGGLRQTYGNSCYAGNAQAFCTVPGKCPPPTCGQCARDAKLEGCASLSCPAPAPAPQCMCTREYAPVCGISKAGVRKTYSNKCLASCDGAHCWQAGACATTQVSAPQKECMCTLEYAPVCGIAVGGKPQTYGNSCGAHCAGAFCSVKGACGQSM